MSYEDEIAEIPSDMKKLRACLRCGLLKSFPQVVPVERAPLSTTFRVILTAFLPPLITQFHENGCDNCAFLKLEGAREKINESTTPYWEGYVV